ncbi:MAG: CoA transferase [Acidimicrobiia bacterium]|nr:CoA transferase [Acidimicrobiia bacterium]
MTTRGAGALAGITVLDLSSVGPAARATRLLADYGADVVKVAAPPDRAGQQPPFFGYAGHRGMKKVVLDLREPEGRDAFLALAARSDVVIESFRPGTVERLGVGYEDVREVNPGIVYCSTTGYGRSGPRSRWAGHDLDYLAVGGYLAMSGPGSDGPPLPGATVADAAAGGMHAALAVVAALFRRNGTGEGAFLDVSVTDGVLWLMSLPIDEHLAAGSAPEPGHDVLSGRYACYATYRAGDGRWLAVAAIEPKFFANLCRELGREDLVAGQYDDDAQEEIRHALAVAFATADRDTWVERLAGADTCVAPVLSVAEVAADEPLTASGAFVEARSGPRRFRQVGAVLAGMPALDEPVELPDPSVTDTDDLLVAAGYDPSEVQVLRSRGVVA